MSIRSPKLEVGTIFSLGATPTKYVVTNIANNGLAMCKYLSKDNIPSGQEFILDDDTPIIKLEKREPIKKISPQQMSQKIRKQMGDYAFVRHMRNLGVPFEDTYVYMFGIPQAIKRGIYEK